MKNDALETLKLDRLDLVLAIGDDGFPGSEAWNRARTAEKALAAFDAAHPEVLAAIQAAHSAEMGSRYQD